MDDRANPSYPVSVPAWTGIVQSVERLEAIRQLFQGSSAIFPSAYFSMARPGLLGACRAVRVPPAQRDERQRRARLCRKEDADGVTAMTSDILPKQRFKELPNATKLRATGENSKASAKVIDDALIALLLARKSASR